MSSQVFAGGLLQFKSTAAAWTDASGLSFYASLLDGTVEPNLNPDHLTLQDFLDANPTRSLLADAKNQALSGLFTQWESAGERFLLYSTGQVVFPTPASGQDVTGVVIHEQTDIDPASSTLWAYIDETDGQTAGGNVDWGTAGNNLRIIIDQEPANAFSGHGLASITNDAANGWDAASIGYALVRQGSPAWSANHLYVADAGLTYCTNFEPGSAYMPTVTPAQKRNARYVDAVNSLYHEISQGTNVAFDFNYVVPGEIAIGVLIFEWTGNQANSRILKYQPISPALTLQAGQSIFYGNTNAADENEIAILL